MNNYHKVLDIINIGNANYILRVEKKNIKFFAGQFFSIGISKTLINREYSVCSAEDDFFLDFLIREVEGGILSVKLKRLKIGEFVKILGPYGNFYLKNFDKKENYIFIATGSGISPFMSLIKTHKNLKYKIYHGIRKNTDIIEDKDIDRDNYFKFITREDVKDSNSIKGRITDNFDIIKNESRNSYFFLCGNSMMVSEVYDKLIDTGFSSNRIFTEVFF
jgi:ferredoxin-NADP reductase